MLISFVYFIDLFIKFYETAIISCVELRFACSRPAQERLSFPDASPDPKRLFHSQKAEQNSF